MEGRGPRGSLQLTVPPPQLSPLYVILSCGGQVCIPSRIRSLPLRRVLIQTSNRNLVTPQPVHYYKSRLKPKFWRRQHMSAESRGLRALMQCSIRKEPEREREETRPGFIAKPQKPVNLRTGLVTSRSIRAGRS